MLSRGQPTEGSAVAVIEKDVELPAGPDVVWSHLVDADLLGDWLGGRADIDPRPGGGVAFVDEDGVEHEGVVESVTARRSLVFCWWEKRGFGLPLRPRVELALEPSAVGTRLRLRESRVRPRLDVHLPAPETRL
jgi:uncharacterized protein YndB with AHSA1/START domain